MSDSISAPDGAIPAGSRWRENASGRVVVVAYSVSHLPWLYYEDDPERRRFCCNVEDFFMWDRFTRLT